MRSSAVLLIATAALLTGCTADEQRESIRAYDVDLVAAVDGSLRVEETIDYDFGSEERHGIVRVVPDRAPFEQTRDRVYPISDVEVQSPTGAPAGTEVTSEDGAVTIQVGDPDTEITGRHTYVLTYRVDGVVDPGVAVHRVGWTAVGTGGVVPIDAVDVRLTGPAGAVPVDGDCAVGGEGSTSPCPVEVAPGGTLTAQAGELDPGEGVTVDAAYPAGTFPAARRILEDTFSPAQAFRLTPATVALAVGGLLALVLPPLLIARRGRPRTQGTGSGPVAPQLTPPGDARPAQLGTLLDGYAQRHEVTATLLDLAIRGHLRIEEISDTDAGAGAGAGAGAESGDGDDAPPDWRLACVASDRRGLRPYEQRLLDDVFADGDVVTVSDLQPRFATIVDQTCAAMYRDVVELGWFHADPAAVRRRWYGVGTGVLVAGVALTVGLALTSTWAVAGVGVVLAGLVILGLAGRMPQRTAAGAQLRERTAAFRDHLAAPGPDWLADMDRVPDLAGAARADPRIRYLPYAVALGVAEEWAATVQAAGRAPAPDWYVPAHGAGFAGVWPALVAFSSPDNPAWTPPAAAGGGSTTYVGGGAGGGGGGSW